MDFFNKLENFFSGLWDYLNDFAEAIPHIYRLLEDLISDTSYAISALPTELTAPVLSLLTVMIPLAIVRWLT